MNALQDNRFTRTLQRWGREIGAPRAIVVVSAHWLTPRSTRVSTASAPETIHDFGGFPAELHAMRYPAPGAPALAAQTALRLGPRPVGVDAARGLDHGAWTVLHRLYPAADVPVFQVSVDIAQSGAYHLAVGRALGALRDDGVLVLGSGNIVHNLGATERGAGETAHGTTAWAEDFAAWFFSPYGRGLRHSRSSSSSTPSASRACRSWRRSSACSSSSSSSFSCRRSFASPCRTSRSIGRSQAS